jgi:hypothetical protein
MRNKCNLFVGMIVRVDLIVFVNVTALRASRSGLVKET